MLLTGEGIKLYRLLAMKYAIKLEAMGITVTKGASWTSQARAELKLPKGTHDELLEALQPLIEVAGAKTRATGGFQP